MSISTRFREKAIIIPFYLNQTNNLPKHYLYMLQALIVMNKMLINEHKVPKVSKIKQPLTSGT
ncbi:MAG: hypothetical protein AVO38_08345 [delta proteobacterium ML8_D]|nr:MAG: hypothetical protein AVO38_08345 [delta proteobacterium ML8_D]